MEPGDPDVLVDDHLRSEQLGPDAGLVEDGAVGRAGRDHRHESLRLRHAPRHPDGAGECVLLGVFGDGADGRPSLVVGARHEHAARPGVEERLDDSRHLRRGLSLGEHRLGRTLAKLPVRVDPGEAEIPVRKLREAVERLLGSDVAAAHVLEERRQLAAQIGHAPIIAAL
jgi:hypothetical protein